MKVYHGSYTVIDEIEAVDRYYTSNTYTQLADETTKFYEKDWTEIYELLKQELNLPPAKSLGISQMIMKLI
jgi:hypothetical protein